MMLTFCGFCFSPKPLVPVCPLDIPAGKEAVYALSSAELTIQEVWLLLNGIHNS